jgi:hypothetical protein
MLTKDDLDQIRTVVKEEVKTIDNKLDLVQEDISEILTALDQHQMQLETRVEKLEEEVGISKIKK